jgi:predicted transcriptional regulator
MEKTTIQINISTLEKLKNLKRHIRESYDEILNNLIEEYENDELTPDEIDDIKIALEEVKRGEVYPIEQVARELGVKLK